MERRIHCNGSKEEVQDAVDWLKESGAYDRWTFHSSGTTIVAKYTSNEAITGGIADAAIEDMKSETPVQAADPE